MARTPDLRGNDLIDSRDIIARIADLESDIDDTPEGEEPDENEELQALRALQAEAEGCGDWEYGATLILDSYFQEYAQELAEDIGAISKDMPWPACHIDWEAAADALKQDYTSVTFADETYWVRS